ncbi:DUF5677 domain-containing protein [Arthrobacter sp. A2-55]|uniref:DUF5677 domain-containing protein n=1 Tax=Arthrobacter sp. A2-55 TaxID=2897337 RepID=UPI0021CDACE4|nr:DUF5677 domain-containing protein [Arthrobacter sp. A2-55]MCU6480138.1 DUF5677 domain-containing protein [Arthrobacter sp. A2-55]
MYKTTEANFRRSITRLLETFHGLPGFDVRTDSHESDINVIGLTFAAAELAQSYLDTATDNRIARAVLGRAILEFSTRALWLALNGETGLEAMRWYSHKKIHQYATALANQDLSDFPELRKEVDEAMAEGKAPPMPPLGGQAEHVDQMMDTLNAGKGMYVMYRGFSQYAHPTLGVSGSYVRVDDEGRPRFDKVSNAPFHDENLGTVMGALIFAFEAADVAIVGTPFKQQLDTLRKQLSIINPSAEMSRDAD